MWRRPILGLTLLLVFSIGLLAEEKEAPPGAKQKPGEVITNSIGMKLALIPAGEFVMGSTVAEVEKIVKGPFAGLFRDDGNGSISVRITKSADAKDDGFRAVAIGAGTYSQIAAELHSIQSLDEVIQILSLLADNVDGFVKQTETSWINEE